MKEESVDLFQKHVCPWRSSTVEERRRQGMKIFVFTALIVAANRASVMLKMGIFLLFSVPVVPLLHKTTKTHIEEPYKRPTFHIELD